MKIDNYKKGQVGEDVVVEWLKKKGFKILERNFRSRWGEVDVVVEKNEVIVFVEVKTKSGERFGEPWEMVNRKKLEQIKRMAKMWCKKNKWDGACRIDVVGVWLDYGRVEKIKHWENVELE